jgi:acetyl-CoA carboxylase carboxyl transferase subunit beta
MVVHRHKLRDTLSKLCRMLSPAATLSTSRALKPIAARGVERGYLNGNHVDGRTIETLARSSNVAEDVDTSDDERFEGREGDAKPRPPVTSRSRDVTRS